LSVPPPPAFFLFLLLFFFFLILQASAWPLQGKNKRFELLQEE
jgi:hypothetical protein